MFCLLSIRPKINLDQYCLENGYIISGQHMQVPMEHIEKLLTTPQYFEGTLLSFSVISTVPELPLKNQIAEIQFNEPVMSVLGIRNALEKFGLVAKLHYRPGSLIGHVMFQECVAREVCASFRYQGGVLVEGQQMDLNPCLAEYAIQGLFLSIPKLATIEPVQSKKRQVCNKKGNGVSKRKKLKVLNSQNDLLAALQRI